MPAPRLAHAGPPAAWGGAFPGLRQGGRDFYILHQAVTQPICTQPDTFALPFAPVNLKGQGLAWNGFRRGARACVAQRRGAIGRREKSCSATMATRSAPSMARNSKPTGAALADFRQKASLKPTDGNNDQLFAALEKQASTQKRAAGLCHMQRLLLSLLLSGDRATEPGKAHFARLAAHCAQCLRPRALRIPGRQTGLSAGAETERGRSWWAGQRNSASPSTAFLCTGGPQLRGARHE